MSLRDQKFIQFFKEICEQNESIQHMRLHFYHGEFSEHQNVDLKEEVIQFAEFVGKCLTKKSLKTLEVAVQIIPPPNEQSTSDFSAPVVQRIVEVVRASEKYVCVNMSLNQLVLDLELSNNELENLASVLIPKKSLEKLSLTKINSFVGGFLSLSKLLTEGSLKELELSLNVNSFWKKKYVDAERHYDITRGTPAMFQIPKERIYEEAFDATCTKKGAERSQIKTSRDIATETQDIREELAKALDLDVERCKLECSLVDEVSELYHIKVGDIVLPLPVCLHTERVSGFHHLFTALRDPRCRLESLHLNRCLIHRQAEYFACLGHMFLENITLKSLKVENGFPPAEEGEERVEHTLPLLLGLRHNTSLTSCDLGSLENITVSNTFFKIFSHCLSQNGTLRTLNLSRWKFELTLDTETENCAKLFLSQTKLTELVLAECEVNFTGFTSADNIVADVPFFYLKLKQVELLNSSIKMLCLDSLSISFDKMQRILKSRDLLFILRFSSLQELDISDKPALDTNQKQKERIITDETFLSIFRDIKNNFGNSLEVLKMANWKLSLHRTEATADELKNIFTKLEKLTTLSLNNIDIISSGLGTSEPVLLKTVIKHLPQLKKLSILKFKLEEDQAPIIFKALKHKVKVKKSDIILYTKMVKPDGLEKLLQCLEESKTVKFKFDGKDGTLEIFQNRKDTLVVRMRSMKLSNHLKIVNC